MDGYEIESHPFYVSPEAKLSCFRGISRERNRLPVMVKRYDFDMSTGPDLQKLFNAAINKGLAQARVDHLNFCKILEMRVDLTLGEGRFAVYHVFEALSEDMGREVNDRKRESRPYSETDIRTLLAQTSSALAFAHSKVKYIQGIAHRDIKPENILKDRQNNYKLSDFDCYFEGKTLDDQDRTIRGTIPYMSPQLRQLSTGQAASYNPFKADVYSLGLTAISIATLKLPNKPWPLNSLEAIMRATVQALGYPQDLHDLLISMLAFDESARPTMQQIRDSLTLHLEDTRSPRIIS